MMNRARMSDPAAFHKPVMAGAGRLTAGGAGDGVEIASLWIDRSNFRSTLATLSARADLAAGKKLTIDGIEIRHSHDPAGAGAEVYQSFDPVELISEAGGEESGLFSFGTNLSGARLYIQLACTPDLDAANADTAEVHGALILTGAHNTPV